MEKTASQKMIVKVAQALNKKDAPNSQGAIKTPWWSKYEGRSSEQAI